MDLQAERLQIELEEDSWSASVTVQFARIVGDTVLMSVQWRGTRSNVRRRNNM